VIVSAFVDEAQLHCKAGDGGAGCVSMRREAMVDKGGPDGGNGGKGGDIWLVADRNSASLYQFRDQPFRKSTSGVHGQGKNKHGAKGDDIEVLVPEGTVVNSIEGEFLADLVNHGDRWMAARGGRGGRGNASFLSNKRRAPTFAEQGEHGEDVWYNLELKLMADVALVGFPNVGKSTFISAVSRAKPKIADYPFTTLVPHLGVVKHHEHEFVIADIPGLIEGASEGKGLGHSFLRHIERSRALLVLCDLAPLDGTSPQEQERILLHELGAFRPELLDRPRLVIGSRADMVEPDAEVLKGFPHLAVSAVTRQGLDEVLGILGNMVRDVRAEQPTGRSFVVHRPESDDVVIEREGAVWVVRSKAAERAVALNDLTDPEAMAYVRERLSRLGVDRALEKAGVQEGERVRIGQLELEYEE
jgi:GTP-binding protein